MKMNVLLLVCISVFFLRSNAEVVDSVTEYCHPKHGWIKSVKVFRDGRPVYRRVLSSRDNGIYRDSYEMIYAAGEPVVGVFHSRSAFSINFIRSNASEVYLRYEGALQRPKEIAVVLAKDWVDLFVLGEDGFYKLASDSDCEEFSRRWSERVIDWQRLLRVEPSRE